MTAKPGTVAEIIHDAETGKTWHESDRVVAVCAHCHLERPADRMVLVDGRWWCADEAPASAEGATP